MDQAKRSIFLLPLNLNFENVKVPSTIVWYVLKEFSNLRKGNVVDRIKNLRLNSVKKSVNLSLNVPLVVKVSADWLSVNKVTKIEKFEKVEKSFKVTKIESNDVVHLLAAASIVHSSIQVLNCLNCKLSGSSRKLKIEKVETPNKVTKFEIEIEIENLHRAKMNLYCSGVGR